MARARCARGAVVGGGLRAALPGRYRGGLNPLIVGSAGNSGTKNGGQVKVAIVFYLWLARIGFATGRKSGRTIAQPLLDDLDDHFYLFDQVVVNRAFFKQELQVDVFLRVANEPLSTGLVLD
jgi:hypothetical protein